MNFKSNTGFWKISGKKLSLILLLVWLVSVIFVINFVYNRYKQDNLSFLNTPSETITPTDNYFPVVEVIDGDTIDVQFDDKVERVRLIGINTPEIVDPRRPVQCFGKEASDKAKQVLNNNKVKLVNDPSQGDRDSYGRLLRYVYLADGSLFNKIMIDAGYAFEYTYKTPYQYREEFLEAQKQASLNQVGLWSSSTCNGQLKPKN